MLLLNTYVYNSIILLQGANAQQKEQLEHVAASVANGNLELACAFIQKSSVEKCLLEIDKRLMSVSISHHRIYLIATLHLVNAEMSVKIASDSPSTLHSPSTYIYFPTQF